MTDNASVKVLVNGAALAVAENVYNGSPEFSYSGRLEVSLSIGDLSSDFVTWFAVACRERSATLTIDYTTGASEIFIVEPGLPLLVQGRDDDTIVTAVVSVDDVFVDIEIMAYTGVTPLNPAEPAFLILDAGAGITEDPFLAGSVTAWTDVRAVSSAPLPFNWSDDAEEEPTLISSDPDFNGRPSVQFGAGESSYAYSGVASVFDFMDGSADGDFTFMMICSFPDDAVNNANYQGIWNTSAGTTYQGYRAYIDPAYRLTTYLAEDDTTTTQVEEFAPKPTVIIWRVEDQELRVYFQGRWSDSVAMAGASPGDNTLLRIGNAMRPGVGALPVSYFRGKIANITVYDSAVDVEEICAPYIASAVADYGVDDTEEQGFPWLSSVVNVHRANRGVNWSNEAEDDLSAWYDTRPEVAAGASTWTKPTGRGSPVLDPEDAVMGQPTWVFEGGASIDAMTNDYTGTTGDHFGGDGMTVAMVMYLPTLEVVGLDFAACILSQGRYGDDYGGLSGISIRLNGAAPQPSNVITYELDTGADQDLVSETGSYLQPLVPYAFVFRCDGTYWWVDELNIATGAVVTSEVGATVLAPDPIDTATSAVVWMGAWPITTSGPTNMGVSEMSSIADRVTNAEVTKFFTYVSNRYGS